MEFAGQSDTIITTCFFAIMSSYPCYRGLSSLREAVALNLRKNNINISTFRENFMTTVAHVLVFMSFAFMSIVGCFNANPQRSGVFSLSTVTECAAVYISNRMVEKWFLLVFLFKVAVVDTGTAALTDMVFLKVDTVLRVAIVTVSLVGLLVLVTSSTVEHMPQPVSEQIDKVASVLILIAFLLLVWNASTVVRQHTRSSSTTSSGVRSSSTRSSSQDESNTHQASSRVRMVTLAKAESSALLRAHYHNDVALGRALDLGRLRAVSAPQQPPTLSTKSLSQCNEADPGAEEDACYATTVSSSSKVDPTSSLWVIRTIFLMLSVVPPLASRFVGYLILGYYSFDWIGYLTFPLQLLGIMLQFLVNVELSPTLTVFEKIHLCLWYFCEFVIGIASKLVNGASIPATTLALAILLSYPFYIMLDRCRSAIFIHHTTKGTLASFVDSNAALVAEAGVVCSYTMLQSTSCFLAVYDRSPAYIDEACGIDGYARSMFGITLCLAVVSKALMLDTGIADASALIRLNLPWGLRIGVFGMLVQAVLIVTIDGIKSVITYSNAVLFQTIHGAVGLISMLALGCGAPLLAVVNRQRRAMWESANDTSTIQQRLSSIVLRPSEAARSQERTLRALRPLRIFLIASSIVPNVVIYTVLYKWHNGICFWIAVSSWTVTFFPVMIHAFAIVHEVELISWWEPVHYIGWWTSHYIPRYLYDAIYDVQTIERWASPSKLICILFTFPIYNLIFKKVRVAVRVSQLRRVGGKASLCRVAEEFCFIALQSSSLILYGFMKAVGCFLGVPSRDVLSPLMQQCDVSHDALITLTGTAIELIALKLAVIDTGMASICEIIKLDLPISLRIAALACAGSCVVTLFFVAIEAGEEEIESEADLSSGVAETGKYAPMMIVWYLTTVVHAASMSFGLPLRRIIEGTWEGYQADIHRTSAASTAQAQLIEMTAQPTVQASAEEANESQVAMAATNPMHFEEKGGEGGEGGGGEGEGKEC